jgi:hypothetical protein
MESVARGMVASQGRGVAGDDRKREKKRLAMVKFTEV